ncbi:Piwi-domain-containing protein [Periconia macrospinosa]|uniref:Piwi-domain-containing protein n=1 Tax=Periconia macrospinosa TaxID=97972 RepID=A0A2V1E398_9PLEO|nr:Piwi-domain-containing protein [Periconia macrospinosa]
MSHFLDDDPNSVLHYPPPDSPNLIRNSKGKDWVLPKEMEGCKLSLKVKDPKYPLRKEFLSTKANKPMLTNHFEYKFNGKYLHEYRITEIKEKDRRRIKSIFKLAIEEIPGLADKRDKFATNYIDTIVAWEDLKLGMNAGDSSPIHSITFEGKTHDTRLVYITAHDIGDLQEYSLGKAERERANVETISKCLNIILSKRFDPAKVHQQSSNKFFIKKARNALDFGRDAGGGNSQSLEIMRGYYYNIKEGMGNIILNFNLATSAFYRPILVSEFLADTRTFPQHKLENELKGLSVVLVAKRRETKDGGESGANENQPKTNKIYKVTGLSFEPIEQLMFHKRVKGEDGKFVKDENDKYVEEPKKTSIADYIGESFVNAPVHGRRAVNVAKSTTAPPIWYAQEQLRIVPYQVYNRPVPDTLTASMVNQAAKSPQDARAHIEGEGLKTLGFTNSQAEEIDSSAPIHIEPSMLRIPYNVLNIPNPRYGNNTPAGGITRWKIPRVGFYTKSNKTELKFCFIVGRGISPNTISNYAGKIVTYISNCGIRPQAMKQLPNIDITSDTAIDGALQTAKNRGAFLVFLAMKSKSIPTYSTFKDLADRKYGLQTVCLAQMPKNIDEYMQNVSMKLNLKLGGINHSVDTVQSILSNNTMVLGADVVHAGSGSFPGTPSIASIVGSVDNTGGKFLGSVRLQRVDKDDKEIIDEVEAMVVERLKDWCLSRGKLPTNIIYYRDGVSSGQYDAVKNIEITAIRKAYNSAPPKFRPDTNLNITAVVVGKRHHTRFYMENPKDAAKFDRDNTPAGTFVDRLVTSPYYQDFFLQSHIGIKGTAKPAHYFVVENEIPGMSIERLRDLTHGLCFSYVRATTGVSYAAPAYYADHLCERARLYVRKYFIGDDQDFRKDLDNKKKELVEKYRKARENSKDKKNLEDKKRADTKAINNDLNKIVSDQVKRDFYKYNGNSGNGNPWDPRIEKTMFWM